ncbi:MAG: hypothetical protein IKZ88_02410 [Neisseriaceae bacterium]|nr:hypothetical protein [Neisseriaceae bacterium]
MPTVTDEMISGSLKLFIVAKLQNNNALARLAVLFILSSARRLLFF